MQNGLDISGLQAEKWFVQFIVGKCEVRRQGTKSNWTPVGARAAWQKGTCGAGGSLL